jgi:hypothetical protein
MSSYSDEAATSAQTSMEKYALYQAELTLLRRRETIVHWLYH